MVCFGDGVVGDHHNATVPSLRHKSRGRADDESSIKAITEGLCHFTACLPSFNNQRGHESIIQSTRYSRGTAPLTPLTCKNWEADDLSSRVQIDRYAVGLVGPKAYMAAYLAGNLPTLGH
jgi:hypothetical protein